MRRLLTSRVGAALGGSLTALLFAGGYAIASGGTINVCVHKHGGGLYAGHCARHDRTLTWNTVGPQGPQGPQGQQGQQGQPGPAGVSMFARVDDTGVLHQHSPGVTLTPSGFTGVVYVNFPQNISNCAAVVSQGEASNNSYDPTAQYLAKIDSDPGNGGNPQRVVAYSFNDAGTPLAEGFDLIVAC